MPAPRDSDLNPLKKRMYLLLTALVGVMLSISAFFYSTVLEKQRIQTAVNKITDERLGQLKNSISATVEIIDSVGSFFDSHEEVSREQFKVFTRPVLERHPELWGIHWIPRIRHHQRSDFERSLRWQGFPGQITALRESDNTIKLAGKKDEYYPVRYSEPIRRNLSIIGYDVSSRELNRHAMQMTLNRAINFTSTAPFTIIQDQSGGRAVVFFRPVFGPEEPSSDPAERHSNIRGFIAALVKPQTLLDALSENDQSTSMQLLDITDAPVNLVAQTSQDIIDPLWLDRVLTFNALGRDWQFRLNISPGRLQDLGYQIKDRSPLILFLGLAFTLFLIWMVRDLTHTHRLAARERDRAQSYLDTVETMIVALDRNGYIRLINRKACELIGCTEEEVLGQLWFSERFLPDPEPAYAAYQQLNVSHYPDEQNDSMTCSDKSHHNTGKQKPSRKSLYSESQIRTSSGELLLIAWHNAVQTNPGGGFTGVLSAGEDITQQRRLQALEKIRSSAMHAALRGQSMQHVLDMVLKGIERQKPEIRCSILLLDDDGQHLMHGAAPSLPDVYNRAVNGIAIGDGVGSCGTAAYRGERVIVDDIQQHPYWAPYKTLAAQNGLASCWSEPVWGKNRRLLGTFAIYHRTPAVPSRSDIDLIESSANFVSMLIEQYQTEARLIQMANTDELTTLPNRRQFMYRLEQEFARSRRYQHPMALCMLDIDHFKKVNDTYGHAVGDLVLQQLAEVTQDSLRETDLAGRLGGEEFAILLPDTDKDNAARVAERIRTNLESMIVPIGDDRTLQITVSIGVATSEDQMKPGLQADELLSHADHCLYYAKQHGRNQVSFMATELV